MKVKENARPYAVHTSRRVPRLMLPKVKEELQKMERNGIPDKVTQPEWCAPMVLVLKKATGKACIYVDFKRLNEAVKR